MVFRKVINEFTGIEASLLKRVVWSENNNYVALLSKKSNIFSNL